MRERLWQIGLDVPDKENAEDHFGPTNRRAGPHRFSLEQPHNNVSVVAPRVPDDGSATGEGQNQTPPPAVAAQTSRDWLASFVFDDIEEARTEPIARDEKQCMFGMKRQLPATPDDGRRERRLLASAIRVPPFGPPGPEDFGPHPGTAAEIARSRRGGPGLVANVRAAATATATAPRPVAEALGPTNTAFYDDPRRRRALRRRASGA